MPTQLPRSYGTTLMTGSAVSNVATCVQPLLRRSNVALPSFVSPVAPRTVTPPGVANAHRGSAMGPSGSVLSQTPGEPGVYTAPGTRVCGSTDVAPSLLT